MNLNELFEIQRELDNRIVESKGLQGQDFLDKKILALQVELGELANEWRGFKYWSNNQEPRLKGYKQIKCKWCNGSGDDGTGVCPDCKSSGDVYKEYNPLLEEYVDCLHFYLSIGNDLIINTKYEFAPSYVSRVITLLGLINRYTSEMWWEHHDETGDAFIKWLFGFQHFLRLGEVLGFTWEEIEEAYLEKNKINHERQANGY